MKYRKANLFLGILVMFGLTGILTVSCSDEKLKGMIILTQRAEKTQEASYITGASWRFVSKARIVALDPDRPGESLKVLSEGFYSACSPEVSFDGKYLLFAGQRKAEDSWQIWELNLKNLKARQITTTRDNCTDPVYLPANRLVFSKSMVGDSLMADHSLFTANLDGSNIQRITFNPSAYFASSVLNDGRILTISRPLYRDPENPFWIIMRPDGTKANLFHKGAENSELYSRARETDDGRIVFTESDPARQEQGNLISVSYNRPLHSRKNLTSGMEGDFRAVFPRSDGKYLVSYRKSATERYALYEFNGESKALGKAVYADPGFDIIDVVVAEEHARPKKLPSEVDPGVKTSLLLCQDINFLDPQSMSDASANKKGIRIEILGLKSSYGIVKAEKDGSFYLKAMADTPIRIQVLDADGKVIHGPCSWIWLRPNERRGCIGCHEDNELAPENIVPMAVRKNPVIIPVHITEITEKEVELE
jgi:hypothetical protein